MKTINLTAGEHTIGNTSASDISIASSTDGNIQTYKTFFNGAWRSWSSTETEEAFQGFNTLDSGRGYYIKNDADTIITLPDVDISFEGLYQEETGINFVVAPRTESIEKNKYWSASSMKTMVNGAWRSWSSTETEEAFQGFNNFEKNSGYVVDISDLKYSSSSFVPYGITLGIPTYSIDTVKEAEYIDDGLKLVLGNRRQMFL